MEARPDAAICNFVGKGYQVGKAVGYARCRLTRYRDLGDVLGSERRLDNPRDATA